MTGVFSRTFAILPRCVPGQAEERREENNRSGHSSISEPHLISAMPLLGWVSGTPELPLPPSLRSSLCLQGVETGVGAGIRRRQTVRNRREKKKEKEKKCAVVTRSVWTRTCALGGECSNVPSVSVRLSLSLVRRAGTGSSCTVLRRSVTSQLPSRARQLTWSFKIELASCRYSPSYVWTASR